MMKPQHFCTNPHARDRLRAAVEADREVNAPQAFGMRVFRADVVAVLDALDALLALPLDAPAGAPAEPIEVGWDFRSGTACPPLVRPDAASADRLAAAGSALYRRLLTLEAASNAAFVDLGVSLALHHYEVAAGLAPADPPARCPNPHCAGGRVGGAWGPACAVCQVGAP